LYKSNNLLKTGHWISKGGNDLSGKKFGIIGFGNIGKDLARLLGPFKCKIYYNDIINIKNVNKNYIKKNKKYIFKNCDFISIHVPYNNNTKNMITKRILKQSKKDLIIINTSRGGVVNEKDILYALRNNKIKGAVLDVFSKEPFIKKSVLNIKNLIAFPHIGGASEESIKKMGLAAIANLT
jgi:D-3-phosphoglycerate dehydrogenase